jgi:hypothetical protein
MRLLLGFVSRTARLCRASVSDVESRLIRRALAWLGLVLGVAAAASFLLYSGVSRPWVFFAGGAAGYTVAAFYLFITTARGSLKSRFVRDATGIIRLALLIETPVAVFFVLFYTQRLPLPNGMGLYWVGIVILAPGIVELLKYLLRER